MITSRRPFPRTAARLFAVPAAVTALLAATQVGASASGGPTGPTSTVTQNTSAGYCEAGISFYYDSSEQLMKGDAGYETSRSASHAG